MRFAHPPTVLGHSYITVPQGAEEREEDPFDAEEASEQDRVLHLTLHDSEQPNYLVVFQITFVDGLDQGWLVSSGAVTFELINDSESGDDFESELLSLIMPILIGQTQFAVDSTGALPTGAWPAGVRIDRAAVAES